MDDNICGGSKEDIDQMIGDVEEQDGEFHYTGTVAQTFAEVGMKAKVMVRSGKTNPHYIEKLGRGVLAYGWEPAEGVITIEMKVNISKKKFGVRMSST